MENYSAKQNSISSVNHDTVIVLKTKDGYANEAAEILNTSFGQMAGYIRQYPFGTAKVLNARLYQSGDYVLWGVFYGAVLIFEKFFLLNKLKKAPAFVGRLYTLFCVAVGWVLFTLEDLYGLKITELDGEVCLHLDKGMGTNYITMFEMFSAWKEQAEKYENGEITKEEYDNWRYNYPESVAFNSRK